MQVLPVRRLDSIPEQTFAATKASSNTATRGSGVDQAPFWNTAGAPLTVRTICGGC